MAIVIVRLISVKFRIVTFVPLLIFVYSVGIPTPSLMFLNWPANLVVCYKTVTDALPILLYVRDAGLVMGYTNGQENA